MLCHILVTYFPCNGITANVTYLLLTSRVTGSLLMLILNTCILIYNIRYTGTPDR